MNYSNGNSNGNSNDNLNSRVPLRFVYTTTYNFTPVSNISNDISSFNLRDIIFNNLNNVTGTTDTTGTMSTQNYDEVITNVVNDTFYRYNFEELNNVSNVSNNSSNNISNLTFEQVAFDFRFPTLELFENIFQDYIQNKNKLNEEEFNNNVDNIKDSNLLIECPICFETYNDYIKIKKCSHSFCENCIKKWLKEHKNTCPVCRVEISTGIKNSMSNNSLNSNESNNNLDNLDNLENLI